MAYNPPPAPAPNASRIASLGPVLPQAKQVQGKNSLVVSQVAWDTTPFPTASTVKDYVLSKIQMAMGTRAGERIGNPTWGCNLTFLQYDPMDGTLLDMGVEAIKSSLSTISELAFVSVEPAVDPVHRTVYFNVSAALSSNPDQTLSFNLSIS